MPVRIRREHEAGERSPRRGHSSDSAAAGNQRRGSFGAGPALEDLSAWLRALVWALGPVAPTTAVRACDVVRGAGPAGGPIGLPITLVNAQGAAVSVVVSPSPLRSAGGHVWYPTVVDGARLLVPAHQERTTTLVFDVPADLPAGTYRGTLPMLAMVGPEPRIEIEIGDPEAGTGLTGTGPTGTGPTGTGRTGASGDG